MSIIHEALKKVQRTTPSGPATTPAYPATAATGTPAPTAAAPKPATTPLTIISLTVLGVAVITVLAILTKLAVETTQHPRMISSVHQTPAVAAPQPAVPATPKVPAPPLAAAIEPPVPAANAATSETPFKIEGIMDMGNKKVALINGNVYEEGQTVNGLMITSIGLDHVTVMENGTPRVIATRP